MRVNLCVLVAIGCFAGSCGGSPASDIADAPVSPASIRTGAPFKEFSGKASFLLTPGALESVFVPPAPSGWKPEVNNERSRGGTELYAASAPAVVVVRTSDGHGSGFLVSPDGLVITNHHVVESGLSTEGDASFAMVHLGRLGRDGIMELAGEPVRAMLLKIDEVNDLALLKLVRPAGAPPLPFVKLSATPPRPGLDCAILGHPSSGMLWTYRPCQVSSVGDFPKDMVNLVLSRLASRGPQRAEIEAYVKAQPPRRIMLTSAQANPGDSGGPVLDKDGLLIGVTFAGPGETSEDKFTYHVHLDAVRSFLTQVPQGSMLLVPDPWSFGPRVVLRDLDGDGRPDVLIAGTDQPDVMLFDVENRTPAAPAGSPAEVTRMVTERRWQFQAAVDLRGAGYTSFYDTDNDGHHDLILVTDEDSMTAKGAFRLGANGRWHFQPVSGEPILSGRHFQSPQLGRRFEALLRALNSKDK